MPQLHDNRTPHKLFLLIACALSGSAGLLIPGAHVSSIENAFPGHTQFAWYATLLTGGVLGLIGITKGGVTGALLEQAAMLGLAGIMTSFACAALAHTGLAAIPGAVILGGFGIANGFRAYQIHQDIRVIRKYLAAREQGNGGV